MSTAKENGSQLWETVLASTAVVVAALFLVGSCLSACFSTQQWVGYRRAQAAVPQEPSAVSGAVRRRGSVRGLPDRVPLARGLRLSQVRSSGRVAFAWRRLRHRRYWAILDENLPDQRALFEALMRVVERNPLPTSDWWVQGEGQRMALQVLDARTGREIWLQSDTPEKLLAEFGTWLANSAPAL